VSGLRPGVLLLVLLGGVVSAAAAVYLSTRGDSDPVDKGQLAPGFELETLEGERVTLASLRGRVVYVNFWATWCAPCRDEAPALQRLYAELHDDGFELLAATIDEAGNEAKVQSFREEFGLGFPILRDPDRVVYSRFGATGVPETYLIDAEGRLAEAYIGPRDWDEPRYARAIRRLLGRRSDGAGD